LQAQFVLHARKGRDGGRLKLSKTRQPVTGGAWDAAFVVGRGLPDLKPFWPAATRTAVFPSRMDHHIPFLLRVHLAMCEIRILRKPKLLHNEEIAQGEAVPLCPVDAFFDQCLYLRVWFSNQKEVITRRRAVAGCQSKRSARQSNKRSMPKQRPQSVEIEWSGSWHRERIQQGACQRIMERELRFQASVDQLAQTIPHKRDTDVTDASVDTACAGAMPSPRITARSRGRLRASIAYGRRGSRIPSHPSPRA